MDAEPGTAKALLKEPGAGFPNEMQVG